MIIVNIYIKQLALCLHTGYERTYKYNQQYAKFHSSFIYLCKTLYVFQTGFPSIIRSTKLHIQRQAFVRTLLLPAASLARQG